MEDGKKKLTKITEITEKTKPKERIRAFDILRGTSILLMLIAHIGNYWLIHDSKWLVGFFFLIFNVQGTNGFTFVAGVGFGYSWWRSLSQSSESNEISQKPQYGKNPQIKRSAIHTLFIFGISICFNVIAATVRQSNMWFEYIWYWNILQTIAICRALGMLLLRVKIKFRLVILAIMIPLVHFLTHWIVPDLIIDPTVIGSGLRAFLYYFLYNPLHADGLLFFLPFFIMGSVAGELIWKNKGEFPSNTKISSKGIRLMRIGTMMGFLLMIAGIVLGWKPVAYDYGWKLLQQINTHPNIQWTGLPLFLVANSGPWALYCLGFELLFIIFIFRCVDIKRSPRLKPATRSFILELFGRFSLTIYLGHYLFLFLPWFRGRLTETTVWFPFVLFMGIISLIAWLLNKPKYRSFALEFQMQRVIRHYS